MTNTQKKEPITVFQLVLLQTLNQVRPKLHPKDLQHLLPAHLTESWAVHGTVGQTQGAGVILGQLHLVTDPVQHIGCRPTLGTNLVVGLPCRNPRGQNDSMFHAVFSVTAIFCSSLQTTFDLIGLNSLSGSLFCLC